MPTVYDEKEKQTQLIQLVMDAIRQDEGLREKYQIGDKFRFVRERLHLLLDHLEVDLKKTVTPDKQKEVILEPGEELVYVYLYNAKGIVLRSWQNMLTPKVFYEYSVNRPIYRDKASILAMLKSKTNIQQHAYLTIAVKSSDIIELGGDLLLKDNVGNPLIKVKEGSLHFDRWMGLTHNGQEYILNEAGELVKKT